MINIKKDLKLQWIHSQIVHHNFNANSIINTDFQFNSSEIARYPDTIRPCSIDSKRGGIVFEHLDRSYIIIYYRFSIYQFVSSSRNIHPFTNNHNHNNSNNNNIIISNLHCNPSNTFNNSFISFPKSKEKQK